MRRMRVRLKLEHGQALYVLFPVFDAPRRASHIARLVVCNDADARDHEASYQTHQHPKLEELYTLFSILW
eukprot:3731809-Rhodomonas_salina.1